MKVCCKKKERKKIAYLSKNISWTSVTISVKWEYM